MNAVINEKKKKQQRADCMYKQNVHTHVGRKADRYPTKCSLTTVLPQ